VLSRVLDRATAGLATVLVLTAVLASSSPPPWVAWAALPLVLAASRAPLLLPAGSAGALVIGLDSSLLVLLGLTLSWQSALVVWGVSISFAELTSKRTWDTRLFNAGVCVVAGAAALAVLSQVPREEAATVTGLVAAVIAAVVYFLVDYSWSAVSIGVAESTPWRRLIQLRGLPLSLACFVGVDSLGFLGVVVLQQEQWMLVLLVVPFAALLWASHSWSNMGAAERRGGHLSAAGLAIQAARTTGEVVQCVVDHAALMVRAPQARWTAPDEAADGLTLPFAPGGDRLHHLHVLPRGSGEAYAERDVEALRTLVSVAEQAHDRLRLLGELARSASTDSLTGLANRALLRDELSRTTGAGVPAALLYIDLDGFKAVNDTQGHACGDAVLTIVADRLRAAVRPDDLVARLGGDEFAVLLRGLPTAGARDVVQAAADRVCTALALPYDTARGRVLLSASVGIALGDTTTPEELLLAGDAAMYVAKGSGGGRSQVCTDALVRDRRHQSRLADELGVALSEGQFEVHYQPVVAALDADVVGFEALIRWQHPERGLLAPAEFLSTASEAGLLDEIGKLVLRTALADVALAARTVGRTLHLSVNANASQLLSGNLLRTVRELLPVDLVRLTVEVTEDELVCDGAVEALHDLRRLGVRIALDDFGTGWSSLSLLRRLPVDVLKLDRSFVADLPSDARAVALARAVVKMAGALGLATIAEGVEDAAQSATLRLMGWSMLQGYYFGRPLPSPSLIPVLLHAGRRGSAQSPSGEGAHAAC